MPAERGYAGMWRRVPESMAWGLGRARIVHADCRIPESMPTAEWWLVLPVGFWPSAVRSGTCGMGSLLNRLSHARQCKASQSVEASLEPARSSRPARRADGRRTRAAQRAVRLTRRPRPNSSATFRTAANAPLGPADRARTRFVRPPSESRFALVVPVR
jgi:hypothetical protein